MSEHKSNYLRFKKFATQLNSSSSARRQYLENFFLPLFHFIPAFFHLESVSLRVIISLKASHPGTQHSSQVKQKVEELTLT